jgi:hypothetical protein
MKQLCQKYGIQLFDRVSEFSVEGLALGQTGLHHQLAAFKQVGKISVLPGRAGASLEESETELRNAIPACQLTSVEHDNSLEGFFVSATQVPNNQVVATLDTTFSCSSNAKPK